MSLFILQDIHTSELSDEFWQFCSDNGAHHSFETFKNDEGHMEVFNMLKAFQFGFDLADMLEKAA